MPSRNRLSRGNDLPPIFHPVAFGVSGGCKSAWAVWATGQGAAERIAVGSHKGVGDGKVPRVKTTLPKSRFNTPTAAEISGARIKYVQRHRNSGGSGNGPEYVQGPVRVVCRDIYDLDRDGDGIGCD
jgi:hypothetical protein